MEQSRPKAFVVHGHNELARLQICEMLSSTFGLDPIVLARQPGISRTIIEHFELHASKCDLAVVLLTADDTVIDKGRRILRSRQNVIFELGYFCASLGRNKVCLVYQEDVEMPSDILGVVYYPFKTSVQEVEVALGKHIRELGFGPPMESDNIVIFVDDDMSDNSDIVKQVQLAFAGRAVVKMISSPEEACKLILSRQSISGCITDIVFRNSSALGGVRVAESAIQKSVPIIVLTGHNRKDIGIAMTEFKRIGLPEDRILTKPVTLSQYRKFLCLTKQLFISNND